MGNSKDNELEVIAAITTAIEMIFESEAAASDEIKAPPYIILPSVLAASPSPWRFVGRNDSMAGRSMVQMKSLRW